MLSMFSHVLLVSCLAAQLTHLTRSFIFPQIKRPHNPHTHNFSVSRSVMMWTVYLCWYVFFIHYFILFYTFIICMCPMSYVPNVPFVHIPRLTFPPNQPIYNIVYFGFMLYCSFAPNLCCVVYIRFACSCSVYTKPTRLQSNPPHNQHTTFQIHQSTHILNPKTYEHNHTFCFETPFCSLEDTKRPNTHTQSL